MIPPGDQIPTLYLCVVVRGWKFEQGRLYRWRMHRNHDGKVRWFDWDACW